MILTVQVVLGWGRRAVPRENGYSCPRSTGAGMPARADTPATGAASR